MHPTMTSEEAQAAIGAPKKLWPFGSRSAARSSDTPGDRIFRAVTLCFALAIAGLVVLILANMALNSRLAWAQFGPGFLWRREWDPVAEQFGALPFVFGTAVSALLALLLAVPVSAGVAIFVVETAPRALAGPILFLVQLLAAIPSVVYGMWGIFVLAPFLRNHAYPVLQSALGLLPAFSGPQNGLGMLTASLILAVMIVPIITAVTTDVLRAVPGTQREAALALGATKWEAARIVLANARSGILGAVIIGLGRAVGETMAVTMLIGNRPQVAASLFAPASTIASAIANEFTEATGELYLDSLIGLGLVLFLVTFIINALARLLVWSVTRGQGNRAHV
jgi:phosphate transport system permease protein